MTLDRLFFDFIQSRTGETSLVVVAGLACAVLVGYMGRFLFAHSPRLESRFPPYPPLQPQEGVPVEMFGFPGSPGYISEQRRTKRRDGNPIRIYIAGSDTTAKVVKGWVTDRSVRGLCLFAPMEVASGTILSVRAGHAPYSSPWVQVKVMNCQRVKHKWRLGCQFMDQPDWEVLLLFG